MMQLGKVMLIGFALACTACGGNDDDSDNGSSGGPKSDANAIACEQISCPPGNATDFNLQGRWQYTGCNYVDASGGFSSYLGIGCDGYLELCGDGPGYSLEELGPSGQGLSPTAMAQSNAMENAAPEFLVYANDERITDCGPDAFAATVVYCKNGSADHSSFECERVFVAMDVGTCTDTGLSSGDWNKSSFTFQRTQDMCL